MRSAAFMIRGSWVENTKVVPRSWLSRRIVAAIDLVKAAAILAIGFGILSAHSHVLENGGVSLLKLLAGVRGPKLVVG